MRATGQPVSSRAEHYRKAEEIMATANSGEIPLPQATPLLLAGLIHAVLASVPVGVVAAARMDTDKEPGGDAAHEANQ